MVDSSIMQHRSTEEPAWRSSLPKRLLGDISAATVSATLVTPAVTIIDRAIVEKSSLNQSLLRGIRTHAFTALKNPSRFIFQAPFGIIWALYAATYTVANGTDTIGNHMKASATGMITFASTTLVNVPLAVWKDVRFAQIFGTQRITDRISASSSPLQSRGFARAATAIFLLRDCVTIFGCFTLAPKLTAAMPEDLAAHPHAAPVLTYLTVPVLTQLVATPLHLLGLDIYMRQYRVPLSDRITQSQRYLPSTTFVRCIRIVPAFGVGCLANMELRSFFHRRLES